MGKGNRTPRPPRTTTTPPDPELLEMMRVRSIKRLAAEFGVDLPKDAGKDKIDALKHKQTRLTKTP